MSKKHENAILCVDITIFLIVSNLEISLYSSESDEQVHSLHKIKFLISYLS